MDRVQIHRYGRRQRKRASMDPPGSQQEARERLPLINRIRNLGRAAIPKGAGDPGDGYSSWSEDEDHPERNVTQPGGPFLLTCHKFIPPTRRYCPIPRFLQPHSGHLESDDEVSSVSFRHRNSSFKSRVGVTPFPETHTNSISSVQNDSEIRRRLSETFSQHEPSRVSFSTRKAQSESRIYGQRYSELPPPPLPYYSLPEKESLEMQPNVSAPSLRSSAGAIRRLSQLELLPGTEQNATHSLAPATRDLFGRPPPVPSPRLSKLSHRTELESLIAEVSSTHEIEAQLPPIPKPRAQSLKRQTLEIVPSVEEVVQCHDDEKRDDEITVHAEEAAHEFMVHDPNPFCPCDGFTSPIHRKPVRVRYREVHPRYTEEPLFWVRSQWNAGAGEACKSETRWPPDAIAEPRPDYLLNNALRVVREPRRIPIPRYQDSSTGQVRNWCTSGLARNYIYKPDFGRVPSYLQSQRKPPQQLCPEEVSSIMNVCHPAHMLSPYFSKS